jgi:hypothetical protein
MMSAIYIGLCLFVLVVIPFRFKRVPALPWNPVSIYRSLEPHVGSTIERLLNRPVSETERKPRILLEIDPIKVKAFIQFKTIIQFPFLFLTKAELGLPNETNQSLRNSFCLQVPKQNRESLWFKAVLERAMDFELRRAREKLEKEQKERKAKAKAKLDRERKAKAEAKKQREAIEAAQRSRRLDAAEAQLKVPLFHLTPSNLI